MTGSSIRCMTTPKSLLMILRRERQTWRCSHCFVHGSAVWAVRDGSNGPRVRMRVACGEIEGRC